MMPKASRDLPHSLPTTNLLAKNEESKLLLTRREMSMQDWIEAMYGAADEDKRMEEPTEAEGMEIG